MRKQIQEYRNYIEELLKNGDAGVNWEKVLQEHLLKIAWYQHERLIHLIVTVLFALLEVVCMAVMMITGSLGAMVLMLAILVLLVPYVGHYYFLENSVQALYLIYDKISRRVQDTSAE